MRSPRLVLALASLSALCLYACKTEPPPPGAPVKTAAANGQPAPASPAAALPERTVEIIADAKGFTPSRIQARSREPLVLRFTRTVEDTCADVVVVAGDPVKHLLPVGRAVEVRLAAPESGALAFACGMNMYRGSVVVAQ